MHCHFCQKKIELYHPESNNLLNASEIIIYKNLPIIDSGFGSYNDGDVAFITDRKLAQELKEKLTTERIYICDECYKLNKDKLIIFEGMGFPWNSLDIDYMYTSVPRYLQAFTAEELFHLSDKKQEKFKIRISKGTFPIHVENTLTKKIKIVDYDEVLIINDNATFDTMKQVDFNKLFVPFVRG